MVVVSTLKILEIPTGLGLTSKERMPTFDANYVTQNNSSYNY